MRPLPSYPEVVDETREAKPARLDVGVIGVGRAGAPVAAALDRAGHRVVAAHAVSLSSRNRASTLLPNAELVEIDAVLARADLVLLAVPDDTLPGLVEGLVAAQAIRPGQFVVHLAGRFGVAVLDPATRAGALPLALHPAMTFTGTAVDVERLAGICFGITAPEPLWPVAEALVVEMGGEPVRIREDARPLYHAALAHGTNHLVTLVNDAMDLLRAAGVDRPDTVLGPMLSAALDNTLRYGDDALTGPVVRGDAGTVADHVAALGEALPDAATAYVALARRTATRALAADRLPATDAEPLLDVLTDNPSSSR